MTYSRANVRRDLREDVASDPENDVFVNAQRAADSLRSDNLVAMMEEAGRKYRTTEIIRKVTLISGGLLAASGLHFGWGAAAGGLGTAALGLIATHGRLARLDDFFEWGFERLMDLR